MITRNTIQYNTIHRLAFLISNMLDLLVEEKIPQEAAETPSPDMEDGK